MGWLTRHKGSAKRMCSNLSHYLVLRKRRMTRTSIIINSVAVVCCLALGAMSCGDSNAPAEQQVLAIVNDTPLTEAQLLERLKYGLGPRVLLGMIDARLISAEAVRRGIHPGREQVELKLSQAASRFGSEHELTEALREHNTSLAEFKDRLRLDAMLDEIAMQEITVGDGEVQQYYQEHLDEFSHGEQMRARMILTETQENAEAIKVALDSGGDFAGLAQALSIDPGTAGHGGDMDYFEQGDYADEITEVAFSLEPEQVSDIFAVPDGYCIVRVEGRRPAGTKALEEVREQIVARLKHRQRDKVRQEWLVQQRQRALLTISDARLRELVDGLAEVTSPPNPLEF